MMTMTMALLIVDNDDVEENDHHAGSTNAHQVPPIRPSTQVLSYPPPYYVVRQSWNRTGPHSLPFSTVLYSSLRLWERISLWQCREYQGKPNEASLSKTVGAVFIPDGIV